MRDERILNDMFNLIEVVIDLDDKLYKRAMKKKYDQSRERTRIFFELAIECQQRESRSNQKYNNLDYRRLASMKLDFTQRRKGKNSRKKQGNKSQKTYYSCGKLSHFARDCQSRNLMDRQQINAMLREILDNQDDIREQTNTEANTPKIESNDDYYLIEDPNQLQKVLDGTSSNKALAFTQEINQILNKTMRAKRPRTPYPHLATNLDDEYDQKDFHECLDDITKHLETLASSSKKRQINQIVNKCEKALESDATIKKEILNKIEQQLSNVSLFQEKIKKAKKYATLN